MHTTESIACALRAAGHNLFSPESSHPESSHPDREAERNLEGRTHYVDRSTRGFFRSRVLSATVHSSMHGLIFSIVESCSANPDRTRRVFRGVVFNIFGTVLYRPALDESQGSTEHAREALYEWLSGFDVVAHYVKVLEARAARLEAEAQALRTIAKGA